MPNDDYNAIKLRVLEVARECARGGAGYSQQRPVLDAVAKTFSSNSWIGLDLKLQQAILTCWHDLFREGILSWGYNLDNPDPPFFHVPERPVAKAPSRK